MIPTEKAIMKFGYDAQLLMAVEDRFLTSLVHRFGFNPVYAEDSVAFTLPKGSWGLFLRQQVRWKRSAVVQTPSALKYSFKKPIYSVLLLGNLFLPLMFYVFLVAILVNSVVSNNYFYLITFFLAHLFSNVLQGWALSFEGIAWRDIFVFSIANTFLFSVAWIYALVTFRESVWGTR